MRSAIKNDKNVPGDFRCNSDYVYVSVVKEVILGHAGLIKQTMNNIIFYIIILCCFY